MNAVSRRKFLKNIFIASSLPLTWLWYSTSKRTTQVYSESNKTIIESDIQNGITFHENFIITKNNSSMKIFSSKCSHLGCRITRMEENEFVCPCHGSRYNLSGDVIKGPAQKSLKLLQVEKDKNKIIIYDS